MRLTSERASNYNGLVTRFGYKTWLIHQKKINFIFYFFILKFFIPYFQLSTFFIIIISILLLPFLSFFYQLGYNLISIKLFLEKKSYIFYKVKAK